MSFAGQSHLWLIALMGAWIAIVFALAARWTRATTREVLGAITGGIVAGAVNAATDAAAHAAGFWRYTEVTTPFGPVLYYLEAGLGCGALALVMRWLGRRSGVRAQLGLLAALAIYAPFRDWATAKLTHLMEFHYEPLPVVVLADSLSSFVIPVLVAYGVLRVFARPRGSPPRTVR